MTAQSSVALLSVAYAILGALLLALLSASRLARSVRRSVRIGAILIVSSFYVVTFHSLQGLLGWAAPVKVPERFQMLWGRVVEPNPRGSSPGAVYLWLEALDDANLPSGTPRAFALPYSQALADRVTAALTAIREGRPQGGRATVFGGGIHAEQTPEAPSQTAMPGAGVPPGGDPSGGGLFDPEFLGGQSRTVDIVPLPAPILPSKDNP